MKIWTVQPISALTDLETKGEYACDKTVAFGNENQIFEEGFRPAYDWLVEKMKEKIGNPPEGVQYPIWAWYKRNWDNKRPDLRLSEYGRRGDELVCIELDIPDNKVVLTDFDAWHFVLNKWYLNVNCEDEKTFANDMKYLQSLSTEEKEQAIQDSWSGVFDISKKETEWSIRGCWVQATFWRIKKENIKKIIKFTCK